MTDTAATDYSALLPDRDITVMGRPVAVREIRFAQTAEAMQVMEPVISALREIELDPDAENLPLAPLEALVNTHFGRFVTFMRMSTGQPREWIESLPDVAGNELAMTVLAVNAGFFLRRLAARREANQARTPNPSDSPTSSPSSSAPASAATPPTSRTH